MRPARPLTALAVLPTILSCRQGSDRHVEVRRDIRAATPSTLWNPRVADRARTGYVDAVKGLAILWVVWWHAPHPRFIDPFFHVPLFFFISGFFVDDQESLVTFVAKRIKRLCVPVIAFSIFGYAAKLLLHWWDTRDLTTFPYETIWDVVVFGHTRTLNVPLWFLLALCAVQVWVFVFVRTARLVTPRSDICLPALLLTSFGMTCASQAVLPPAYLGGIQPGAPTTYFEVAPAMSYVFLFSLGHVFGKSILAPGLGRAHDMVIGGGALLVLLSSSASCADSALVGCVSKQVAYVAFSLLALVVGKRALPARVSCALQFYGRNSLVVLGAHGPLLDLVKRPVHKLYGAPDSISGLVATGITVAATYVVILLVNRYLPSAAGRGSLVRMPASSRVPG